METKVIVTTDKKWYLSKVVWVNVVATGAIIIQAVTGKELVSPEIQLVVVSMINLVLRTITKENIIW